MKTVKQAILEAYFRRDKTRPFLVAVDGLSGAGKTTLVDGLNNMTDNVAILHIDDFIVERSRRYNTGQPEYLEYYQLQWDIQGLVESLFEPLQRGQTYLMLPYYERDLDSIKENELVVESDALVIIEGIFLLRKEWCDYFDYIVYLDCPRDVRYKRALNRDTYIGNMTERIKKYERRYWPGEDYYLKTDKPCERADLVYRNSTDASG